MRRGLGFDDVLIEPQFSTVKSRTDVDTSVDFMGFKLQVPVIASNMKTVTDLQTTILMDQYGALSALHRFDSVESSSIVADYLLEAGVNALYSIGVRDEEYDRLRLLYAVGVRHFLIDVAHGATTSVAAMFRAAKELPNTQVAVGNFATRRSFDQFIKHTKALPDAIKIGIGGGAGCTTRETTGVGIPYITNILDFKDCGSSLIIDGGCRTPGDVCKALAAGAAVCMIGKMFAQTVEAPNDGQYFGNASIYNGNDSSFVEGTNVTLGEKRRLKEVVMDFKRGLQSSMSYVGANNLKEFQERATFIEVSAGAFAETYGKWKGGR